MAERPPSVRMRRDTVHAGHPQIHEDDVGLALQRFGDRHLAVVDDLDDREVVLLVQGDLHRLRERPMIVGDDDGDLCGLLHDPAMVGPKGVGSA